MTARPWWWLPAVIVVAALYTAVLVWILTGAHDDNGAARIPVEVGRPMVCGTFGCEEVDG